MGLSKVKVHVRCCHWLATNAAFATEVAACSCRNQVEIAAAGQAEVAKVTFSESNSAPVPKFLNPDPEFFQIWESDSCSDFDYNHRSNRNLPLFSLKKEPQRLLLLPKWKSDSGSRSGFSRIFGSGSERKTQNPAGVDSGTPDPVPPPVWMCWSCCKTYFSQIRNVLSTIGIYLKEFFHSNAQIKLKLGEIYISRLSVFELWRSENVDHMHVGYWELFISKARNVQQNHHSNKGHSDGVSLFDV